MKFYLTIILGMVSYALNAQLTHYIVLVDANIHTAPTPTGGGFAPQSNYSVTTKTLVAEPYPSNFQPEVNASTIHPGAGNIPNVLFGGDLPSAGTGYGAFAVPIHTTQIYDQSHFPIMLESNFYNENSNSLYNESYLSIVPSNYQYFASPTTHVPAQTAQREGFLFGGPPSDLKVFDHQSATQPSIVYSNPHSFATTGSWYNMKVMLDEFNGDLIIRWVKINNQIVISNQNLGQVAWLNSFRLGLAVDDLADMFIFSTQYSTLDVGFEMNDTIICVGECISLTDTSTTEYCTNCNTYQWTFPGADSTTSTQQHPSNICYSNPGTYPVHLTVTNNAETKSTVKLITVKPLPEVNLGNDTILCNNQPLTLDATLPNATYLWSDNSTNPTLNVNAIGIHWVETTVDDCTARDSILVNPQPIISLALGNDTTVCPNEPIFLEATQPNVDYLWQDGSTDSTFTTTQEGNYFVTISNVCEILSDTIEVTFTATELVVDLGIDTVLCVGETLVLDVANPTAESYLWQDGSTSSSFTITQSGMYFVAVSDTCVTVMDTINVIITGNFPVPNLGIDTVLCEGLELTLDAFSPIANTYLWNDNSTNSTLTIDTGGQFIATATNNCGSRSDTINIELLISELAVDLGNDTTLCNGDVLLLQAFDPTALSYEWQDGSTNSTFMVSQSGTYQVTLHDFCTSISDSILIEYIILDLDLGNDTAICQGRSFQLDVFHPKAANYTWHDGSTNSSFTPREAGTVYVTIDNHCESISDSMEVIVSSPVPLIPNLGHNQVLCPGATQILDATIENALTYIWQDSTEGPIYVVTEPGIYQVTVSNACISLMDEIEFTADACCNMFLPDAFTPNNDGKNDTFNAFTNCHVSDFSMMIFDRWGSKVFESTDIDNGWDGIVRGEAMCTGVYIWILQFNDGFTVRKKEGSVTLIR